LLIAVQEKVPLTPAARLAIVGIVAVSAFLVYAGWAAMLGWGWPLKVLWIISRIPGEIDEHPDFFLGLMAGFFLAFFWLAYAFGRTERRSPP
jgi:hypothetical protein